MPYTTISIYINRIMYAFNIFFVTVSYLLEEASALFHGLSVECMGKHVTWLQQSNFIWNAEYLPVRIMKTLHKI